jgi:hypothetical protein
MPPLFSVDIRDADRFAKTPSTGEFRSCHNFKAGWSFGEGQA